MINRFQLAVLSSNNKASNKHDADIAGVLV